MQAGHLRFRIRPEDARALRIEKEHPDWILPNSPAQRVSEGPTKGFTQKAHLVPMLSLGNTYSEEELHDFVKRVHKLLEKGTCGVLLRAQNGWHGHLALL